MTVPMIEVYLSDPDAQSWHSVDETINSVNKFEWFDDIEDWNTIPGQVEVNGEKKTCPIYLSGKDHGWVRANVFFMETS